MGARLVLELARRGGVLGTVVALDPGGFWQGWERHVFFGSIWASIRAGARPSAMDACDRVEPDRSNVAPRAVFRTAVAPRTERRAR